MIQWLAALTAITFLVTPKNLTAGLLKGLLCMLVRFRIGGFYGVTVV